MKRISKYLDSHPLLSVFLGTIALVVITAIGAVLVPTQPDYVDAAVHVARTT